MLLSFSDKNSILNIFNYQVLSCCDDLNFVYSSLLIDFIYSVSNYTSISYNFNFTNNFNEFSHLISLKTMFNNHNFYKFLSINIFNNQIISYNSWIYLLYLIFVPYFLFIFFYVLFNSSLKTQLQSEKTFDIYNTTIRYLIESEKELGSVDDMFLGVAILITIFGWFFFGTIFLNFFSKITVQSLYLGFPLLMISIFSVPLNMIWNYGILFIAYLRGSSNTTILLFEYILDVVCVSIIFIRFLVQNVRFLLMFFAFFECYNIIFDFTIVSKNYYFYNLDYSIFFNIFYNLLNMVIFYIYNVYHLLYTILSHFFNYLILIFWFFSFLYTTFLSEKLEVYFKKK